MAELTLPLRVSFGNRMTDSVRVDDDAVHIVLDPLKIIRDAARDEVIKVLQRHGYDIPGVADLCAGAALKVLGIQSPGY